LIAVHGASRYSITRRLFDSALDAFSSTLPRTSQMMASTMITVTRMPRVGFTGRSESMPVTIVSMPL